MVEAQLDPVREVQGAKGRGVSASMPGAAIADGERMAVLEAEREVETLRILAGYIGLSELAIDQIDYSLGVIRDALVVRRAQCRMNLAATKEAA
jgi:hypothetical protein